MADSAFVHGPSTPCCLLLLKAFSLFLSSFLLLFLTSYPSSQAQAQEFNLLSFNRISTQLKLSDQYRIGSKTVVYSDYTSYDTPKRVFFQQSFDYRLPAWGKVSLSVQLLYRRYHLLPSGSQNEYRPVQILAYSHGNQIKLQQRLRFEQRFKAQYSNRWWYSFDFYAFNQSGIGPKRITNDFLFDFNSDRRSYENRFNVQVADRFLGTPIQVGLQYRTRKLFSGDPLEHQLVIRTDWKL